MPHRIGGVNFHRFFQQWPGVFHPIHLNFRIGEIEHRLDMLRIVIEFGLKLLSSFMGLALGPQQVTQTEMYIGLLGIGRNSGSELACGPNRILHFIQGFAHQHVRFGRLSIQRHDPVKGIQNTLVLPGQQAAMRQGQQQRQVLCVVLRGPFQIGGGCRKFSQPIVRHADQNDQALRLV